MILETALITKVALAVKGAVSATAHKRAAELIAKNFVHIALSYGLVPALQNLVTILVGIGVFVGVVEAINSLIKALEEENIKMILSALADLTMSLIGAAKKAL